MNAIDSDGRLVFGELGKLLDGVDAAFKFILVFLIHSTGNSIVSNELQILRQAPEKEPEESARAGSFRVASMGYSIGLAL